MRLAAVCHDAGGAEIISSWLDAAGREHDADYVLDGPAQAIFARKLGAGGRRELGDVTRYDLVLCGSSYTAALERNAVRAARRERVRCAVWLDHWVNYRMRFELDGELVLPDEVWVGDEHARGIARRELPGADVRLAGNPYLDAIVGEVRELGGPPARRHVLYAGEPGALKHAAFAGLLAQLADTAPVRVRVRRHPSEPVDAYDHEIAAAPPGVTVDLSDGTSLAEDCAWAGTVAGYETMALVVALLAGRRALAVRPHGAPPGRLPYPEIEQLVVGAPTPS